MTEAIKWSDQSEVQRDATIAEHVFGWQWIPAGRYGPHVKEGTAWLLPENGLTGITSDVGADWTDIGNGRHIPRNWIPRYSTSLDAAWLIVAGFDEIELTMNVEQRYHCTLYAGPQRFDAMGGTPHEAIEKAALQAAGVEIE